MKCQRNNQTRPPDGKGNKRARGYLPRLPGADAPSRHRLPTRSKLTSSNRSKLSPNVILQSYFASFIRPPRRCCAPRNRQCGVRQKASSANLRCRSAESNIGCAQCPFETDNGPWEQNGNIVANMTDICYLYRCHTAFTKILSRYRLKRN